MKKLLLLFIVLLTGVSGVWADDWTPSIPAKALIDVGDKVSSVTAASSASDNAHWYLITQVRGGESAIYDNGTTIYRGSTSATAASFEYASASTNAAYLVRFISTGSGLYNVQFGTGRYAQKYDTTPGNVAVGTSTTPGEYAFYNCNEGTGSYFGWNLGSETGKSVNNNSAGNTVAFWNDGKRSGTSTSDNAIWYVYQVSFEEGINVTYNLYESDGETFVSSQTVLQRKSSAVSIPDALKNGYLATDYTYETTGTIGDSDCSIKVVRTLKANGYAPSLPSGAYISVSSTAATAMTPATSASDNDHWYFVTQNRISYANYGAYTPIYDNAHYSTVLRAPTSLAYSSFDDVALSGKEKYLVRFIETGESTGLYYMQFADGSYITGDLTTAQTVNSAGTFAFYKVTTGTNGTEYTFGWNKDSNSGSRVDSNGANANIAYWGTGANDGGSKNNIWTIYPVELTIPEYYVQYAISFNSNVVYTSDVIPASVGDVINTLPNALKRDFCNYTVTETTVSNSGTTTVPVTMTWDGPFNISASFAAADWKLLQMRQGGYNVKYVADAASYPLEAKGLMTTEDDAYLWAFIGNPYDGFEIVNKAAGSTMKLYAGASPANGGYPLMSSENTTKWLVNGNPKNSETGGFGLQVPGKSLYINDYSGGKRLSYWSDNTTADAGSTLTVADQYPLLVANNISPYFSSIGNYFSLSATAEDLIAYGTTWTTALTTCDKSTYDDLVDYVSDASHLRYPSTGNYRIKNVSSGKYVGYGTAGYTGKGVGLIEVEASNPSSVLHLTRVSDGVYTISTQGLNVQTQSTRNMPVTLSSSAGSNHTFTPLSCQVVSIRADLSDANGYWFRSSWGSAPESVITWNVSSDVAKWVVEDATSITVPLTAANDNTGSSHTYATLCVPFNVTNLVGASSKTVKAYAPTKEGDYIVPGTGATTITAGTPVMLIGEEGASSVTATIGSNYATSPATTNVLTGTFTGTTIDTRAATGTNYVLGFDESNDNRIGFYHVNNSSFALKANRAYLSTGGGSVKGFAIHWDDLEDGVQEIDNGQLTIDNAAIYNLAGQRLNKLQKGVNIVNGKKVLVK